VTQKKLLNISNIWPFHQHMSDRGQPEENEGVFKKVRVGSPPSPGVRHAVSHGKAAATWTGGAYRGVREHGQGARTPLACLPKLGVGTAAFFKTP
jgi:hypothetical protein